MSDSLGERLHERAEAILAERNRIGGRAPKDYTDEVYLRALAEAEDELTAAATSADEEFQALLERVLALREEKVRADEVDIDLLREKYEARLAELDLKDDDGLVRDPTDEEKMQLLGEIVEEFGAPDTARRGIEIENRGGEAALTVERVRREAYAVRRELLLNGAVEQGIITAGQVPSYRILYDLGPGQIGALLAGRDDLPPAGDGIDLSDADTRAAVARHTSRVSPEHVIGPRADDIALHLRAEELLEAGGAERVRGRLVYTEAQYLEALQAASEKG
jgi:hypothetical protein